MQNKAKEDFNQAIGWCVSLITDYRVRLGTWGLHSLGLREWVGIAAQGLLCMARARFGPSP